MMVVTGALVYCVMHGLVLIAALIVIAAAIIGWFGRKLLS
jgi:hypothetical protein